MSLGLDTTVVLRLLTGQPVAEAAAARRRLEQAVADQEDIVATDLVLSEAYFALQYQVWSTA
jgi:predicted nucleic acid-binding protein